MCGLVGILSGIEVKDTGLIPDTGKLEEILDKLSTIQDMDLSRHTEMEELIPELDETTRMMKSFSFFHALFHDREKYDSLSLVCERMKQIETRQKKRISEGIGRLDVATTSVLLKQMETIKDISWRLSRELLNNLKSVRELIAGEDIPHTDALVSCMRDINAVFNSIDRLEVRGRDSAGISVMFLFSQENYEQFILEIEKSGKLEEFENRRNDSLLANLGIRTNQVKGENGSPLVSMTFVYKVAAEIGRLGDNIRFIRNAVARDTLFKKAACMDAAYRSVVSHTRWASVGAINEPNCHPVDNRALKGATGASCESASTIHVCLNGDIDNYHELREEVAAKGYGIEPDITTDTKIIPLLIAFYVDKGDSVTEAFRKSVSRFSGSHAISMHTDLCPGRIFLAQKGSGQTIFVGLAKNRFIPASEVYGFVEETDAFVKMHGEKQIEGKNGITQGQIFILNQKQAGNIEGITGMYYDGTPIPTGPQDIRKTEITSRDIDRQDFPHYFLKEISEAPDSFEKTLENRWKIHDDPDMENGRYAIHLDESIFPSILEKALEENRIRRIYFVGQGTAGVAAQACANILRYYMDDPSILVGAMKASELSGFSLMGEEGAKKMSDTLVVAISQSGTTTDTNRTVDMVRDRGAFTLGIVNRRDSDLTFKVNGVMYTSSGRDIEMSVASTKAFYAQIVAGALLGLQMARIRGRRSDRFVHREILELLQVPAKMREVLSMKDKIAESATRTATSRTYWAVVGSGPNKSSADEIRIKLSELCYKTISTDYVEDKKHIDLSSEPLIIVCAAGTRDTVIGDIVKDVAIFKAHKAAPIVIADKGESRFSPYTDDLFLVPPMAEHLAPVLNTLVGHIWGYYAALSINEGSEFLYHFREEIREELEKSASQGMDVYELLLEKGFRERIAAFYQAFRKKRSENKLNPSVGLNIASDLTLLLKYLSGRLPVSDFEMDFGIKGTALNMLETLFTHLSESIGGMARPVDAIKHQAKTVTVGTSRITEKTEGILFNLLLENQFRVSQLTTSNVMVVRNLQKIIKQINGYILYQIEGLSILGEPVEETTIRIIRKEGDLKAIPSRVETDSRLLGTKRIIVRQGNVYIGKGRVDDRSILVIPVLSSEGPGVTHLILTNIDFRETIPLQDKIKALGGKYEHIKNIVQEKNIPWKDELLEQVETEELFGRSAEKISERLSGQGDVC